MKEASRFVPFLPLPSFPRFLADFSLSEGNLSPLTPGGYATAVKLFIYVAGFVKHARFIVTLQWMLTTYIL